MDGGEENAAERDLELRRQLPAEPGVVVPEHGVDRRGGRNLPESDTRGDIIGVHDGVAPSEGGVDLCWQAADASA